MHKVAQPVRTSWPTRRWQGHSASSKIAGQQQRPPQNSDHPQGMSKDSEVSHKESAPKGAHCCMRLSHVAAAQDGRAYDEQNALSTNHTKAQHHMRCRLTAAAPAVAAAADPAAVPASLPLSQAHQKLKPPIRPNTSNTSPHRYRAGSSCNAPGSTTGTHAASGWFVVLKQGSDGVRQKVGKERCRLCRMEGRLYRERLSL